MTSDEKNCCRVCGLLLDWAPWGEDWRSPSFEFCPCCGVEWGYGDNNPAAAGSWRERWLQRGGEWDSPSERPPDWDRAKQLADVPAEYK
jgi:hypothetical protein